MSIVITGADGFIGRNLQWRLREAGRADVVRVTRSTTTGELPRLLGDAEIVFHLGGVNRPANTDEFDRVNAGFTVALCEALRQVGSRAPVVFASSTQATLDNPYGRSKLQAEHALSDHMQRTGAPVHLYRLTNVFGKWSRPYYNSVVATFCQQLAHGQVPSVHDPGSPLKLVYVDDVVAAFVDHLRDPALAGGYADAGPMYETTVGALAAILQGFVAARDTLMTDRVGTGLTRALHATFLSYLSPERFDYRVPVHGDTRGDFVEMLKTPDCGQFSYFTAHPGVTRGGHYHHSKTEKFLVIQGTARFGFRHIETGQTHELLTRGGEARVVETIPGWTHDITNVGSDTLIVMLWANEVFDRARPDTVAMKVKP